MTDVAAKTKSDNVLGTIIAFLAVVFFLFSQFVFGFLSIMWVAMTGDDLGVGQADIMAGLEDPTIIALPTIWSVLISNLFVMAMLWLYLRRGDRLRHMGWYNWSRHGWQPTLGVAVACIAGALAFNFIYAEYLFPDLEMQALMKDMIASIPKTVQNQILLFMTIAVVAPLVEEVVFRGMLQKAFAGWMPSWAAILVAAFIFAVIHMQPEAIGPLMALGAAFGIIYHYTGSLRLTILLHVVNNAAALILQPLEDAQQADALAGSALLWNAIF